MQNDEVMTLAIRPREPIFFFEIDQEHSYILFRKIRSILKDIQTAYNLDSQIYETKHGYHIIVESTSWDQTIDLRKTFFSWIEVNYFNDDPTKAALRVSAKRSIQTGNIISPAPRLVWESSKGLPDLRRLKDYQVEIYKTSD